MKIIIFGLAGYKLRGWLRASCCPIEQMVGKKKKLENEQLIDCCCCLASGTSRDAFAVDRLAVPAVKGNEWLSLTFTWTGNFKLVKVTHLKDVEHRQRRASMSDSRLYPFLVGQ